MSKIVTRFNFETNSSSMHSLSIRREEGAYTAEELARSEALTDAHSEDVIITLNCGSVMTDEEEIKRELWLWRDDMTFHVSSYHVDFINSPMEVMASLRGKLHYAIASALYHRGTDKDLLANKHNVMSKIQEIRLAMARLMPGIELVIDGIDNRERCNVWSRGRNMTGGVENDILYPFLQKHNISMFDFLTDSRYVVIVNYGEYCKMKALNMVDESKIVCIYPEVSDDYRTMAIENGVWKLAECDISFGRSPFRVLGTPEGKARYALAYHNSKSVDEVLAIMQEIYPEMKSIELPVDEWEDDGVCHGFCDDDGYIIDDIPLREFILNKKYVVISDGDEYCVWSGFKKTPLFNRDEYPEEIIRD